MVEEITISDTTRQDCPVEQAISTLVRPPPLAGDLSGADCCRDGTCLQGRGILASANRRGVATCTVLPVTPRPPRADKPATADFLCRQGAMALAVRLERYWHERGYPAARFWAEPIEERFGKIGTSEIYRIKSNLLNGLPPR